MRGRSKIGVEKVEVAVAPGEGEAGGVEGVVGQNQPLALGIGEAVFDEGEIEVVIAAVEFIADDGMAEVGEMDADLVFAAGAGDDPQEGKTSGGPVKTPFDPEVGLGGGAVGAGRSLLMATMLFRSFPKGAAMVPLLHRRT